MVGLLHPPDWNHEEWTFPLLPAELDCGSLMGRCRRGCAIKMAPGSPALPSELTGDGTRICGRSIRWIASDCICISYLISLIYFVSTVI